VRELEPLWLTNARTGLATLVGEKETLETQHQQLKAKHTETITSMDTIKQVCIIHACLYIILYYVF